MGKETSHCEVKSTFKDGELTGQGEYIIYYENGNKDKEFKGIFKEGSFTEGEVIVYDEKGNKSFELKGTFENDCLIERIGLDKKRNGQGEIIHYNKKVRGNKKEDCRKKVIS